MSSEQEVRIAREEVDRARERLALTLGELRQRLAPKTLLNGAWHEVRDRGQDLAGEAVHIVRSKPIAISAIAAAVVAFAAREPLWRALSSLLPSRDDAGAEAKSILESDPARPEPDEIARQQKEVA